MTAGQTTSEQNCIEWFGLIMRSSWWRSAEAVEKLDIRPNGMILGDGK
jgi:hypothetical protein